jgi:hypothetical protein
MEAVMKPFKIYMIYHSHIDIGYTERQEKIANFQADFTNQAVNYVLSNNDFRYTAEGFWAVEQYLNKYGTQGKNRLVEAIKTNRFELTMNYLHFSELLDRELMDVSFDYGLSFVKENNLKPSKTAMINDVNGFSWEYGQAMYDHGIRYLYTSINTHHGGVPFHKPLKAFYWETPKKNKILVWSGLSYHKGNLLGLIPGWTLKGDAMVPGLEPTENGFIYINSIYDLANERIHTLVKSYQENSDYPYDFIPISASGLYTDNSPLSDSHVELINEWNRVFGNEIKIELVTLEELFKDIEKQLDIPTYNGDWNDYWSDGVLSTPDETRLFLNARRNKNMINLLDKDHAYIDNAEYQKLVKSLVLYAEHTWGHSASWSDPYRLLVKQLDQRKAALAIQADVLSHQMLDSLYQLNGEGEFIADRKHEYVVVNPHDQEIISDVYLPTDFWEEGKFSQENHVIIDENNQIYSTQRKQTLRGSFFCTTIPLFSKERKVLRLVSKAISQTHQLEESSFKGKFYEVSYDSSGIKSILYQGEEVLGKDSFVTPVYQVFKGGSRQNAAGFGYQKRDVPLGEVYKAKTIDLQIINEGSVFKTLRYSYSLEGTDHIYCDITMFYDLPKIEVSMLIGKNFTKDPEGIYAKLSFNTLHSKWLLDKPETLIEPGEQLPGTCFDYYTVEKGVILSKPKSSISINLLDSPLVTFDRIKLWEFNHSIKNQGDLFVWIANNKWETNFRTETAGYLESRFIIGFNKSDKISQSELTINQLPPICLRK